MNAIITARAAVGIYLALKSLNQKGRVIVPANLCYAAIYPVIYAGMDPLFCDVDEKTGNVTLNTVSSVFDNSVVAAILPHMYGNPIEDLPVIAEFLHDRNVVLIEDCASAMGAQSSYSVGNIGDYTVYSTGHSKTLDLGGGGILVSRVFDLASLYDMEMSLPPKGLTYEKDDILFSKLYRLLRNDGQQTKIAAMIYSNLAETCKNSFLHRIEETEKRSIISRLQSLDAVIEKRRCGEKRYRENLEGRVEVYPYRTGAVPWRFNFFVEPDVRRRIISKCLDNSLPVSDWYPSVLPMFGIESRMIGVQRHEERILNFPLPLELSEIDEICFMFLRIMDELRVE